MCDFLCSNQFPFGRDSVWVVIPTGAEIDEQTVADSHVV